MLRSKTLTQAQSRLTPDMRPDARAPQPRVQRSSEARATSRLKAPTVRKTILLCPVPERTSVPPALLQRLGKSTVQAVMAIGQRRRYAAGAVIFSQGSPHNGVFLIESGVVKSYYSSEEGRELTLGYWTAGHYVGAPQMFGGGCHAWTSAATTTTQCLWLPGKELRRLALAHADLAVALLDALVHKSECYCALLQLLATHSMRERLARLVHMLAAADPDASFDLSHRELASMIGSTRQWVSASLARFVADGLLEAKPRGLYTVTDARRLLALT